MQAPSPIQGVRKVLAVVFQTAAQTNNVKNGFEAITVTNWVKPGPYLRIVNGQLYNAAYSKLWENVATLATVGTGSPAANPNHFVGYWAEVETVADDKITCGIYGFDTGDYGIMVPQGRNYKKSIVIYNYPNPKSLVTGQIISGQSASCQCMRVENYISKGVSYEAYDCGIQSTNLVPVVKEVKTVVASTNLIQTNTDEKK